MRPLPPDVAGPDNDLADLLDHYVQRAIGGRRTPRCTRSASAGARRRDRGQGLRLPPGQRRARHPHEPGQQRRDSPATTASGRTAGCCCTSPARRDGLASSWRSRARPGTPTTDRARPRTSAAPSQEDGADPRHCGDGQPGRSRARARGASCCSTPRRIRSTWRAGGSWTGAVRRCPTPAATIAAGPDARGGAAPGGPAEQQGGVITLLDADGLKVDGVAYTRDQARREGWSTVF